MKSSLLAIVLLLSANSALARVITDDFSNLSTETGAFVSDDFYFTASSAQNLSTSNDGGLSFGGLMVFNFYFYEEPLSVKFDTVTWDSITDGPDFQPRSSFVSFNFSRGDIGDYWVEAGFFPATSSACDIQGCTREEILQQSSTTINSISYVLKNTPPIPEPETYAMMLAGLGLLGINARKRLKRNS